MWFIVVLFFVFVFLLGHSLAETDLISAMGVASDMESKISWKEFLGASRKSNNITGLGRYRMAWPLVAGGMSLVCLCVMVVIRMMTTG